MAWFGKTKTKPQPRIVRSDWLRGLLNKGEKDSFNHLLSSYPQMGNQISRRPGSERAQLYAEEELSSTLTKEDEARNKLLLVYLKRSCITPLPLTQADEIHITDILSDGTIQALSAELFSSSTYSQMAFFFFLNEELAVLNNQTLPQSFFFTKEFLLFLLLAFPHTPDYSQEEAFILLSLSRLSMLTPASFLSLFSEQFHTRFSSSFSPEEAESAAFASSSPNAQLTVLLCDRGAFYKKLNSRRTSLFGSAGTTLYPREEERAEEEEWNEEERMDASDTESIGSQVLVGSSSHLQKGFGSGESKKE